ncbi:hypothetical protein MHU86_24615 [Fragilaria crotonensis]|nr:hypothetical protein MHU86_24615 [Fragilaria crotonensis]
MEWHGRITATDNLDLFTELEQLKSESIILPATPVIPILTDADFPDDDVIIEDMPPPVSSPTEEIPAPIFTDTTDVAPPARRNLTSSFGEGAVTRSRTRQVTMADVGHRSDDNLDLNLDGITELLMAMNASLQSDPQLGCLRISKSF